MSFRKIHILSVDHAHTTAKYFDKAIRSLGQDCVYWSVAPELSELDARDLLLFVDPAPDWPLKLENVPCRTATYLIDVHQHLESRLRLAQFFDLVFVVQRDYISEFKKAGCPQVHWIPLGCDIDIHYQPSAKKEFDVGFVGKMGNKDTWRYQTLSKVLPRFKTNDLLQFVHPTEMGAIYGRSKIVFNASIGRELNMRFFEALASGALLVTDRIPEALGDLFIEGQHYIGYTEAPEAIEKIQYYLEHDVERSLIAKQGHELALEQHTYGHRWQEMARLAELTDLVAPARGFDAGQLASLYANIYCDLRQPKKILKVIKTYGLSLAALKIGFIAVARWVNARVPLTPRAIRYRFMSK